MKISGKVIQPRNIKVYTNNGFEAIYRGKRIYISSDHGFGLAMHEHLTRYLIDVVDIKTGMKDVDSYQDCHSIRDAIIFAMRGSCLV